MIYDVCVIGSGPAGLASAIALASRNVSVVLIESGNQDFDRSIQHLSDAQILTPESHGIMEDAVRRGLGGTSALWGGRCVPLDPVDFDVRDFVPDSGWPFEYDELAKYYDRASIFLGVKASDYNISDCKNVCSAHANLSSKFNDNDEIRARDIERWTTHVNSWKYNKSTADSMKSLQIVAGNTCTGFTQEESNVTCIQMQKSDGSDSSVQRIRARYFVVACGGIESTRLVLNALAKNELSLAGATLVGKNYIGHLSGKIADIVFEGLPRETIYGFEQDGDVYIRRRITFARNFLNSNKLLNIAFWLDNPPIYDPSHKSGVLSSAYLALCAPVVKNFLAPAAIRKRVAGDRCVHIMDHFLNCLRSPIETIKFCFGFVYKRYFANPRLPGFFTYSPANRYLLHYHSEQQPNLDSTIELSDTVDALGLKRAKISLRWSCEDARSILRAHHLLDEELQKNGIGRLEYRYPIEELEKEILLQAIDGYHQTGSLRMATEMTEGVTDSYGRLLGVDNLFVASSAVFPTSGQANSTLPLVAFAIRQAEYIARKLGKANV